MIKIVRFFFFRFPCPKVNQIGQKNLLCASVRTKKKSSQNNAEAALEMKSFSFEVLDSLKGLLRSHRTQSLKFFQIIERHSNKNSYWKSQQNEPFLSFMNCSRIFPPTFQIKTKMRHHTLDGPTSTSLQNKNFGRKYSSNCL